MSGKVRLRCRATTEDNENSDTSLKLSFSVAKTIVRACARLVLKQ